MIGGVLVDALVVAAIAAFAWAGGLLGASRSIERLVATLVGAVVAVLLRDPLGGRLERTLGVEIDNANLLAMFFTGTGVYLLIRWLLTRYRGEPEYGTEGEALDAGYDDEYIEAKSPTGVVIGGVLGFAWGVFFVALLVLLPADNLVSRSAVRSFTGGQLIRHDTALRWIVDGFPHLAQPLPKGVDGAVLGPVDSLPMRGEIALTPVTTDNAIILDSINRSRRTKGVQELTYNPDLAEIAERTASGLALDRTLELKGAEVRSRIEASIGATLPQFDPEPGVITAWAHAPQYVGRAISRSDRAADITEASSARELGIGAVEVSWFNGTIYVLLFLHEIDGDADEPGAGEAGATDEAVADAVAVDPAVSDSPTADAPVDDPFADGFDTDGAAGDQATGPEPSQIDDPFLGGDATTEGSASGDGSAAEPAFAD